mmetsp:Transcript_66993/g.77727  ORF Transcript_66993/g.77727 Transcript_66993/m.77727 type:complete len:328 (+) Transcript_66993:1-984(+)
MDDSDRTNYRPKINYVGENGYDAGGLLRGWFSENSKMLFDPSLGLFKSTEGASLAHPNVMSRAIPGSLDYFEFAGYFVAQAMASNTAINVHFTRSFYKILTDRPLNLSDLEEIDQVLYSSLLWILENDIDDLFQTFSYEVDIAGERHTIDLIPEGSLTLVTNKNKKLYVKLLAMAKMYDEVQEEIKAFIKGFSTVIPIAKMQVFTPSEFETIVAGASFIDVEDMKKHAQGTGGFSSEFMVWFWEIMREFSQAELSALLYFVTGSTNVRYGGFQKTPFVLYKMSNSNSLPISHTCSSQIDLPEYESKEKLREKLLTAIFEGAQSYELR